MSERKLRIPHALADRIRSLHPKIKARIKQAVEAIQTNPDPGKELKDELTGIRSYRVGQFRILHRSAQEASELINVGPQAEIYKETERLLRKER